MSRRDMLPKGDPDLELPELGTFGYLIELLGSLGLLDGDRPHSWQNLESWQKMTSTPLSKWEAEQIMNLSRGYYQASREFSNSVVPSPKAMQEFGKPQQESSGQKLKNVLRLVTE